MSVSHRLERKIEKLEQKIDKQKQKMNMLQQRHHDHVITDKKFSSQKARFQSRIRNLDAQIRILKGGLVKQKHHLDKSAE